MLSFLGYCQVKLVATFSNSGELHEVSLGLNLVICFFCLPMKFWYSRNMFFSLLSSVEQEKAIPLAIEGKDILARAKTGSGKTAA